MKQVKRSVPPAPKAKLPWPVFFQRAKSWAEYFSMKKLETRCYGAYQRRGDRQGVKGKDPHAVIPEPLRAGPMPAKADRPAPSDFPWEQYFGLPLSAQLRHDARTAEQRAEERGEEVAEMAGE